MYRSQKNSCPDYLFSRPDVGNNLNQQELQRAADGRATITCLCRGWPGAPLHVRRGKNALHLVRSEGTAHLHSTGCPHAAVSNLSAAYGAPTGSITLENDRVLVNFKMLFSSPSVSTGVGGGKKKLPCHGPRLLALTWLLIMQSDLNVSHPRCPVPNPFQQLRYGAKSIDVRGCSQQMNLDTLLVLPVSAHPDQVPRNYAKLWQAENMKDPVLIAALLPPVVIDQNGEEMIDLKTTLGVPIKIYPRVLNRALMKFTNAASRWRRGGDVLMLALASADRFTPDNQQSRVVATVRHMSLLPVTSLLTPLPTPILERVFNQRQASGEGWATGPQDDGLLAQWSGR